MPRAHTPEHLQQALAELRCRHADWPDDVAAVLDDPIRGRLLRVGASLVAAGRHICRAEETRPLVMRPAVCRPDAPLPLAERVLRPLPAHDRKRAAAGERDDD